MADTSVETQATEAPAAEGENQYDQEYYAQYYAAYGYDPASVPQTTGTVWGVDGLEYTPDPNPTRPAQPAKRQVGRPNKNSRDAKGAGVYNVYYDRWYTEGERRGLNLEKALTRCNPEKDSGFTKAQDPGTYFCVHFAHGCCTKGPDCVFLHRIPTKTDRFELTRDCFGREKYRDERDDMGGVGTFERDNRTLYVGRVGSYKDTDNAVRRHFSLWGEIENLRVLESKAVAFVRYKDRANAEFAREAMLGQSLDKNEILNVRWATEDPNPRAKEENFQRLEAIALKRLKETMPSVGAHGSLMEYESYYPTAEEATRRVRKAGAAALGDPTFGYTYVDESAEVDGAGSAAGQGNYEEAAYAAWYYQNYYGSEAQTTAEGKTENTVEAANDSGTKSSAAVADSENIQSKSLKSAISKGVLGDLATYRAQASAVAENAGLDAATVAGTTASAKRKRPPPPPPTRVKARIEEVQQKVSASDDEKQNTEKAKEKVFDPKTGVAKTAEEVAAAVKNGEQKKKGAPDAYYAFLAKRGKAKKEKDAEEEAQYAIQKSDEVIRDEESRTGNGPTDVQKSEDRIMPKRKERSQSPDRPRVDDRKRRRGADRDESDSSSDSSSSSHSRSRSRSRSRKGGESSRRSSSRRDSSTNSSSSSGSESDRRGRRKSRSRSSSRSSSGSLGSRSNDSRKKRGRR
ncbi:hypothetical protein BJ742DRAFT_835898 [Cladochytrium replicatum]|nr:hypothetical protein BJ742DRAFT_835898 [Cladochytrium replicatum]